MARLGGVRAEGFRRGSDKRLDGEQGKDVLARDEGEGEGKQMREGSGEREVYMRMKRAKARTSLTRCQMITSRLVPG